MLNRFIFLFIAIYLLFYNTCFAAITFDNDSEKSVGVAFSSTLSHTIGSGSNRILIATYEQENGTNCSSITYNGQNLTKVGTVTNSQNSAEIWYLLEASLPSAGAYDTVFNCNNGSGSWVVSVITLAGAAQSAPEASNTNTASGSATITSSITTLTNGAWVVDSIICGEVGGLSTTQSGQTERHDITEGFTLQGGSSTKEVSTAGATNMGWSGGGTNRKAHIMISVAPASSSTITQINGAIINGATIN